MVHVSLDKSYAPPSSCPQFAGSAEVWGRPAFRLPQTRRSLACRVSQKSRGPLMTHEAPCQRMRRSADFVILFEVENTVRVSSDRILEIDFISWATSESGRHTVFSFCFSGCSNVTFCGPRYTCHLYKEFSSFESYGNIVSPSDSQKPLLTVHTNDIV